MPIQDSPQGLSPNQGPSHEMGQLNFPWILSSMFALNTLQHIANNSPNSYQNAVLKYNSEKFNPLSYLPQTPNNSPQALYGNRKKGGMLLKKAIGGDISSPDEEMDNWFWKDSEKRDIPSPTPEATQLSMNISNLVNGNDNTASDEDIYNSLISQFSGQSTYRQNYAQGFSGRAKPGVDLSGIDPGVMGATNELLNMFPGLSITSGRRNWGDKDAHPKGRAVDVSGDNETLKQASEYYANKLVPQYGFSNALPVNHGTGPHIHVGYYEEGGNLEEEAMKSGGWIKGAVNPNHAGYCTPMTKSTCTPRRKAFARRAKNHFKEEGGSIKLGTGGGTEEAAKVSRPQMQPDMYKPFGKRAQQSYDEGWYPVQSSVNGSVSYRNNYTPFNTIQMNDGKGPGYFMVTGNQNGSFDAGMYNSDNKQIQLLAKGLPFEQISQMYFTQGANGTPGIIKSRNEHTKDQGNSVSFQKGGEYDLSEDEIQSLIAQGYKIQRQ